MSWFTAPPKTQRWAFAFSALVTATAVPIHAQAQQRAKSSAAKPVHVVDENAPTVLQAEEITGRPERELNLTENAEVTRDKTRLTSDTACYKQVEDQVDADGNVKMWRFGDHYTGDTLKLNMDTGKGYLLKPTYKMEVGNGQGHADRVDFISQEEAQVVNGTYSTCEGPNPDWYLRSSTLDLDTGRDVGTGKNTIIYFKGVPILGTPAISFSLSGARRSGWLAPTPGFASKNGFELTVPYYFNIAPNRDLTILPHYIQRRGLQLGADARYLGETSAGLYRGETYVEFLPNDKLTQTNRYLIKSNHLQDLAPGWTYSWDINTASDNNYPNDFSKNVAGSAERQLLRELRSEYRTENWSLTVRAQNYQVLQDPAAAEDPNLRVTRPYDRLPSVNFHAGQFDAFGGFDWSFDSELTRFWHPESVRGNRLVAVPQVSYPIIRPGYFITPKVMLSASAYQLDYHGIDGSAGKPTSPSSAIPTVSLDSGLVFERPSTIFGGVGGTQTLEPRLFYVYTPYRDQSTQPNFDTADAGFNLTQIFSENRFIGSDRIGDANQVTAALVSRFLQQDGVERLRLTFGQRFYFNQQRVQLGDGPPPDSVTHSDILLAATGKVSETWTVDSLVQYNASDSRLMNGTLTTQYQPAPKKVLNFSYRYLRDSFKNIEVSSQWPLSNRLYGVGRVSYSVLDKRLLESLVALEYKGDCWVFRMGAQRFVTSAKTVSTPIFFQLELNGLSSNLGVGANGLETFSKTVPGYQPLNPPIR
ncbi:LPS-assembly protein LptD [Janthinobacterium agaricidamnosum]|uniref:LPS-assembly protein LptD n=1 Tax=Janthinobacterium agaricidamnosum NBRC 102515 = DSM 9628 TaxID=1349767 RepID=W0UX17_9BURK|nr:LPS-assembly protein LptD [Janthinobacterium agaricidamnosum]CDG81034.1 organic solvent tolerance family protein [Janthinobacterium agaricidamnosum NBRC 102515 = DSM 9628]